MYNLYAHYDFITQIRPWIIIMLFGVLVIYAKVSKGFLNSPGFVPFVYE